ncbi:MAG: hypothetical protein CMD98_02785 [Gammaproteobacteria bacterium]|nr:hypothetical protein [Gammaproteobacteria bacterium]
MKQTKQHILIVDDELEIRKIIQEILSDEGYSTATASSAEDARNQARSRKPDLVFLDIWMPGEDGISLLKDWKDQPETDFSVVMISGHATIETAIEATKLGAKDFIEKPVSIEKLLAAAEGALPQKIKGEDVFSHLIQNTQPFSKRLEGLEQEMIKNKIFVMQSEEGQEKVAWARALHLKHYSEVGEFKQLQIKQKETSIEQERKDVFETLEDQKNATIFIENIKNLFEENKAPVSKKLIACTHNRPIKIFVSATDTNEISFLEEKNIAVLDISPLRNTLKEVPQILDTTIKFFVERDGHDYRRVSLASQNMLSKYQWPGNLRQLVDLAQALLSRKDKEIVNVDEIQEIITLQGPSGNILIENNLLSLSMKEAKKLFERAYLTRQLELVGGKISELSRRVDMERTNLYRKLQSLDIEYKKKKKPTS